jgi:hypothetical protein
MTKRSEQSLDQSDVLKNTEYVMKIWELFKKDYDKNYSTEEEEKERSGKFIDNLKLIIQENLRYHEGLKPFKLQINQFADMSLDEFHQKLTGLNSDTNKHTRHSSVNLVHDKVKNTNNTRISSENPRRTKPGKNRRLVHKTTHKLVQPSQHKTEDRPTRRTFPELTTEGPTPVIINETVDYRQYMNPIENQGTCGLVCFIINKLLFLTICFF